jgi:hypothetical protein
MEAVPLQSPAPSPRLADSAAGPPYPLARKHLSLYLLACATYLYLILFIPPWIPVWTGYIDGIVFLNGGRRMLTGELPYRDYFQFVTPGTDVFFWACFKLLGVHLWVGNLALLLMGIGFAWLSVVIGRHLLPEPLVYLPGALFLLFGYGGSPDPTHHWFSGLAATGALAVVIGKRNLDRLAITGALCALAATFTQTLGCFAFCGFAIFLFWEGRREKKPWRILWVEQACLVLGFLVTLVAANLYFVWKAGLYRFVQCTLVYLAKFAPAERTYNSWRVLYLRLMGPSLWPDLREIPAWLVAQCVVPAVYLCCFVRQVLASRTRVKKTNDIPLFIAFMGFWLYLAVALSPARYRIFPGAVPAMILLCWLVRSRGRLDRVLRWMLWVGVLLLAMGSVAFRQTRPRFVLQALTGPVAFERQADFQEFEWVRLHTRPSQYFFHWHRAWFNFLFDLRDPAEIFWLTNTDFTRPEQVANLIRGLDQHHVHYVVWCPTRLDVHLPWNDLSGDHLEPLRGYLHAKYRLAKIFSTGDDIWERNELTEALAPEHSSRTLTGLERCNPSRPPQLPEKQP